MIMSVEAEKALDKTSIPIALHNEHNQQTRNCGEFPQPDKGHLQDTPR